MGKLFQFEGTKREKQESKHSLCFKIVDTLVDEVGHRRGYSDEMKAQLRSSIRKYLRWRLERGITPEGWAKMLVDMENVEDGKLDKMCARLDRARNQHFMVLVPDWEMKRWKKNRYGEKAPKGLDLKSPTTSTETDSVPASGDVTSSYGHPTEDPNNPCNAGTAASNAACPSCKDFAACGGVF